jgi:thiamine biosynthesis lipoprotein
VPGPGEITAALRSCGPDRISVNGDTVSKTDPKVRIDLGGIGQGYAVGRVVELLRKKGILSALIDLSGDIYALGTYRGRPWRIGIKDPDGDGLLGVVALRDRALVTSGDYENFFEADGVRYAHILDPRTGYPARLSRSVTVIHPDPVLADAWSTALFVLGPWAAGEAGRLEPGLETVVVGSDGGMTVSPGLRGEFTASEKRKK